MSESIPCPAGHAWSGIVPKVDESIMSVQNHNLMGVICDCKKFIYWEEICGCPAGAKHWEISLKENILL